MNNINITDKPPNKTLSIRTSAHISSNKINTTETYRSQILKKLLQYHRLSLPIPSILIPSTYHQHPTTSPSPMSLGKTSTESKIIMVIPPQSISNFYKICIKN